MLGGGCAAHPDKPGLSDLSFNLFDANFLAQLPAVVRDQFPFVLTAKRAVHKSVVSMWDTLISGVAAPMNFSGVADAWRQQCHEVYYEKQKAWLTYYDHHVKELNKLPFAAPMSTYLLATCSRFFDTG